MVGVIEQENKPMLVMETEETERKASSLCGYFTATEETERSNFLSLALSHTQNLRDLNEELYTQLKDISDGKQFKRAQTLITELNNCWKQIMCEANVML